MKKQKETTTKAIKLTSETHKLMVLVTAKIMTETNGEVTTMIGALKYLLEEKLEE